SYLSFNQRSNQNIFSYRNLRMAFRLAIDTKRLVSSTLDTKGENADKGLVPPGVTGYKFDSLKGFGYDPVFYYPPKNKRFSEMTIEEKNMVSHRGVALQNMVGLIMEKVNKLPAARSGE
ncbi:MAG: hypothetical protein IH823_09030, partial [Candidatus Dadabacteria bacterium]|nr:hypothetical protein [Candidatus Dadabacteria bacterium]